MYLIVAIIIFVAAIVYSGYDPESAELLGDNDLALYYILSFLVAVAWPLVLIGGIMAGLGYGIFLLGKSLRKK